MTLPRTGPNADTPGKINTAIILWGFRVQPAQPIVITIWLTHQGQFVIFSPTISRFLSSGEEIFVLGGSRCPKRGRP